MDILADFVPLASQLFPTALFYDAVFENDNMVTQIDISGWEKGQYASPIVCN